MFLSAAVRDTSISPDDQGNGSNGTQSAAKISGDLHFPLFSGVSGNLSASYATIENGYWGRFRIMKDFGSFSFGPEFVANGDDSYALRQYGLTVSDIQFGKFRLGAKAGLRKERDIADKPYIGIDLSGLF